MNARPESSPRADDPRRATRTIALLLIGVGALILLLNSDIASLLWRVMLPVGLIAVGLDLVTEGRQRRRIAPAALLAIAVLVPLVGISQVVDRGEIVRPQPRLESGVIADDVDRLNATLKLTAGSLRIDSLDDGRDHGIIAQIDPAHDFERAYRRDGRRGMLDVGSGPLAGGDYHFRVAPDVPLDLSVEMGAGDARPLDFDDIQLQRLDLKLGVGSASIQLPEEGVMQIDITSSAGEVVIDVPDELEARIEIRSRLGNVELDDRFERRDGAFVTAGYQSDAPDRADITITASVGSVRVR